MIIDSYRCIVAVIISPYHSLANALFPDVVGQSIVDDRTDVRSGGSCLTNRRHDSNEDKRIVHDLLLKTREGVDSGRTRVKGTNR